MADKKKPKGDEGEKPFATITQNDIYNKVVELENSIKQVHEKQDITNGRVNKNEGKINLLKWAIGGMYAFLAGLVTKLITILK